MIRFPATQQLPPSCLVVLALLLQARREGRIPPSFQELADALGWTKAPVWRVLTRLREAGLVSWEARKSRTLRLTCRFEEVP